VIATKDFLVAPCTRSAAQHAVLNWHYSQRMPVGKLATFGLWERGRFTGSVIYGRGATPRMGAQFGLTQVECVELVRVALDEHDTPVTQVVASTLRQLRVACPGLQLIVSYADTGQGHHGGIYQAGNWIYTGTTGNSNCYYLINGETVHGRTVSSFAKGKKRPGETGIEYVRRAIDPNAHRLETVPTKHRYVYPLDRKVRRSVAHLAQPYPARPLVPDRSQLVVQRS
jgi:hypothetical protein